MVRGLRWSSLFLQLWAAAACTQNFSAFHFGDTNAASDSREPTSGRTADSGVGAGVAVSNPNPESDQHRADAGGDAAAAGPSDASTAHHLADAGGDAAAAGPSDASTAGPAIVVTPDGSVDEVVDASDEDAGVVLLSLAEQCTARWPDLQTGSLFCRECACDACAGAVVDCLSIGDEQARARCRDVLACALKNHCRDDECYCASSGCGYPRASGDGPCAGAIEAAAGGKRSRVFALRQQSPPMLEQPYLRAVAAISCVYGSTDDAGPRLAGKCATSCD